MNASTRGSGPSGGPLDDILPEQELFCLTAKSLWVISIRTAVPRTTDGVPSEADYRNGRLVNKSSDMLERRPITEMATIGFIGSRLQRSRPAK